MTNPPSTTRLRTVVVAALICAASSAVLAENIDPAGVGRQYAWAENVGWINAEPNDDGGPGAQVGDFSLTGWMWGENIGWISLSCANTSSCGTTAYGVTNDTFGVLSGFAWAENAGWINFGSSSGGVTINRVTGDFGGYAWGENIGWISFSCVNTGSCATTDYRVTTGWSCASAPPAGTPALSVRKSAADAVLSWPSLPAAGRYDVVRGSLNLLRSSGGNFTAATDACLADDHAGLALNAGGTPLPGNGFWFLLRGVNCGGSGTFNVAVPSQIGDRDAEINASPVACP